MQTYLVNKITREKWAGNLLDPAIADTEETCDEIEVLRARIAALEAVINEVPEVFCANHFQWWDLTSKSDLLAKHGVTL